MRVQCVCNACNEVYREKLPIGRPGYTGDGVVIHLGGVELSAEVIPYFVAAVLTHTHNEVVDGVPVQLEAGTWTR